MYKRASNFMNSGRFAAVLGTSLDRTATSGTTSRRPFERQPEKITVDERDQLGRGQAAEPAFLDAVQTAITGMVRNGIRKPSLQAARLNAVGPRPFKGSWTPRLVVMFFQRQDERRKARATLEKVTKEGGAVAAAEATRGAVRRTDMPPANPVLSERAAQLLLGNLETVRRQQT